MAFRLERPFVQSFAYQTSQYWNDASPTLSLISLPDCDADAEGRNARDATWLEETQTSPDNDLMDVFTAPLGSLARWYLTVRGEGSLALYVNGSQQTTTVTFDTSDLWSLVDVGASYVRDFTETVSLRVWGAATIKCGALYLLHRPLVYDAVDVLVGSPPNTTTTTDAGSIAATVAKYQLGATSASPDKIIEFTPALNPTESIFPLLIGREAGTTLTPSCDDTLAGYLNATTKNGTQFGLVNPTVTAVGGSSDKITPSVLPLNLAQGGYPPAVNTGGNATFDSDDVLAIYAEKIAIPGTDPVYALYDQIVLVRDCASAFFTSTNTGSASSFSYSWSDGGQAPVDHYQLVVTDQAGDGDFGDGNVLQDHDPVTSPFSVSGLAGPVRVYILSVTADGDFACVDYDEFTAVADEGQIIRYR